MREEYAESEPVMGFAAPATRIYTESSSLDTKPTSIPLDIVASQRNLIEEVNIAISSLEEVLAAYLCVPTPENDKAQGVPESMDSDLVKKLVKNSDYLNSTIDRVYRLKKRIQ